jgi:hypothetical protein
MVRPQKVHSVIPDVPYSEFYGNQFLFLSEGDVTYETIAPSLFIELFKAMQWIRYNGVSMASLVRIISILCPEGLVKISRNEVSSDGRSVYLYYVYDNTSPVSDKESRFALLEYLINLKFKQIILVEEE